MRAQAHILLIQNFNLVKSNAICWILVCDKTTPTHVMAHHPYLKTESVALLGRGEGAAPCVTIL